MDEFKREERKKTDYSYSNAEIERNFTNDEKIIVKICNIFARILEGRSKNEQDYSTAVKPITGDRKYVLKNRPSEFSVHKNVSEGILSPYPFRIIPNTTEFIHQYHLNPADFDKYQVYCTPFDVDLSISKLHDPEYRKNVVRSLHYFDSRFRADFQYSWFHTSSPDAPYCAPKPILVFPLFPSFLLSSLFPSFLLFPFSFFYSPTVSWFLPFYPSLLFSYGSFLSPLPSLYSFHLFILPWCLGFLFHPFFLH